MPAREHSMYWAGRRTVLGHLVAAHHGRHKQTAVVVERGDDSERVTGLNGYLVQFMDGSLMIEQDPDVTCQPKQPPKNTCVKDSSRISALRTEATSTCTAHVSAVSQCSSGSTSPVAIACAAPVDLFGLRSLTFVQLQSPKHPAAFLI